MSDKTLENPPKISDVDARNDTPDQNTPCDTAKTCTPDKLNVPKAFKYPERYTSPTDQMMSPVTRRILARCKMSSKILPPAGANQPKGN